MVRRAQRRENFWETSQSGCLTQWILTAPGEQGEEGGRENWIYLYTIPRILPQP